MPQQRLKNSTKIRAGELFRKHRDGKKKKKSCLEKHFKSPGYKIYRMRATVVK